jgi:S-formylglutathione hydrolase FrmB
MVTMVSRRSVLLSGAVAVLGAGVAAVEYGLLPGRVAFGRVLGRCDVDAPLPSVATGPLLENEFTSKYRQRLVRWMLALPPGPSGNGSALGQRSPGLPVALVLHGRGSNARAAFDDLGLHRYLAAHVATGGFPFALASVDGGASYWHPRANGDDALGMIVNELLPRLRDHGLNTDRIAVMGWSMGGYGALLLARQSARGALDGSTVVAAAASSPALFPSTADAAPGAFDGSQDFAAWGDLLAQPGVSPTTTLFVACGDSDAFTSATRRYRRAVHPVPAGEISRGCHDVSYWRSQAPAQLAIIGQALGARQSK